MNRLSSETLHASCVAINGRAVLIEGRSGTGKSDLALRLIDRGGTLVSDDYTVLTRRDGALTASPPVNIAGKMEVRGLGLIEVDHTRDVPVALVVVADNDPVRMPAAEASRTIAGVPLPELRLSLLEPSAPIKVERALMRPGPRN
ncbi:HPr kinase/phosphorylase [Sphingomonas sp. AX6]|uniref:HPr kinase/phosphorylase n=1 Tax=Sphingomonas sp. AX6 TaxID=2653171 RepID=UPI0012F205C5|nr:HPr kinase/phosphatase C-terminal domain-containing protein [Sphingomonas sp. AX6]VXC95030.1 Aldolase [Sphingomonas sp. AX6]